jgi:hypothetical protein
MKYDFCSIMTMVLNRFEQAEEKARNGQESNPKSGVSANSTTRAMLNAKG